MILDTTTRSAQIVLGEATVTTACDIVASYAKVTSDTFVTACAIAISNGVTPVTVVPHPAYGGQFQINEIRVHNNDTIAHRVILRLLDGATARIVLSQVIAANGDFVYTPSVGATAGTALVPGQLPGTATNDNALAGNVGEYISSPEPGSPVVLTSTIATNLASISLPPGDWDVWGTVYYNLNAATLTTIAIAWLSTVSATQPANPNSGGLTAWVGNAPAGFAPTLSAGRRRISLATTTTVYVGTAISFTVNSCSGVGFIAARRPR